MEKLDNIIESDRFTLKWDGGIYILYVESGTLVDINSKNSFGSAIIELYKNKPIQNIKEELEEKYKDNRLTINSTEYLSLEKQIKRLRLNIKICEKNINNKKGNLKEWKDSLSFYTEILNPLLSNQETLVLLLDEIHGFKQLNIL